MLNITQIQKIKENILSIRNFINMAMHEDVIDEDIAEELKQFLNWLDIQELNKKEK